MRDRRRTDLHASGRMARLLLCLALGGCGSSETDADPTETAAGATEAITETSQAGPVEAKVSLQPTKPRLGDPLILTLEVTAEPGVTVEMPEFGEALGRFQIIDFAPRAEKIADGSMVHSQRYTLQAPMSGRQRIPPLRIEIIDERPGPGSTAAPAATGDAGAPAPRELLTEELSIEIASVLPDEASEVELRPARGRLGPRDAGGFPVRAAIAAGAVVLLIALLLGVRAWRQRARRRARWNAADVALGRLARLERGGLPAEEEADAWYVELSDIVRHYLEDRYGVRAPELTTEEFLREANRARELSDMHRSLLSTFLAGCDRVKFAQYRPEADESSQALAAARSFIHETRLRDKTVEAPSPTSAQTADAIDGDRESNSGGDL